jgi:hypothetical protein
MDVESVIAGVVELLATVPAKPLAETTDTLVTVPLEPVADMDIVPAPLVIDIPVPAVNVDRVKPVPFPMFKAPFTGVEESPVPPLATATTPVTLAALPVVFWLSVGTSAA